jgi:hypothetical protein
VTEPRVGVQEVRRAVQRHHGLAGARPAVDDECATRAGADDRVLVGLDGAEHVAHLRGPAGAETGDERGLVVERRVGLQPLGGEDLVPVVGDTAAGPPVAAAADQPEGVGVGGREEWLRRRRPPVDQQPAAVAVGEPQPSDVQRLPRVLGDDAAEAQVQAEPAEQAQPRGQPVHLLVALEGGLPLAARLLACGVEALGQVGDGVLETLRHRREVLLVVGDQGGVGLVGQVRGEGEGG